MGAQACCARRSQVGVATRGLEAREGLGLQHEWEGVGMGGC